MPNSQVFTSVSGNKVTIKVVISPLDVVLTGTDRWAVLISSKTDHGLGSTGTPDFPYYVDYVKGNGNNTFTRTLITDKYVAELALVGEGTVDYSMFDITTVVPPITSILTSINIAPSVTVEIGDSITLPVTCKDQNGSNIPCPLLKWGSGTSNVTVDNNGVVTAVSLGTALVNCWDVATGLTSNICSITIKTPTCRNPKYKCSGIACISDNCDGTGTFTTPDCNNTCVSSSYTVNMTIVGNGIVTVSSGTRDTEYLTSSNSRTYSQFDEIHYNAVGGSGYQFSSFSIDGNITILPDRAISAINSNKNMTVIFTPIAIGAIVLNSVEWVTPESILSKIRLNVTTNGSTSTILRVDADVLITLIYNSAITHIDTTDSYPTNIPHGVCLGTPTPTQCKNLDAVSTVIPPVTPPGCTNPKYKWIGGICASDDCDGTGTYTDSACTGGGGGEGGGGTGVLSSITIEETKSVQVGKTVTLTATCKDANGNTGTCPDLVWQSDNESIAKVSAGVITGVSVGTANILVKDDATSQIISNTAVVTVKESINLSDWLQKDTCIDSQKKYCAKNWMFGAAGVTALILLTRKKQ